MALRDSEDICGPNKGSLSITKRFYLKTRNLAFPDSPNIQEMVNQTKEPGMSHSESPDWLASCSFHAAIFDGSLLIFESLRFTSAFLNFEQHS